MCACVCMQISAVWHIKFNVLPASDFALLATFAVVAVVI